MIELGTKLLKFDEEILCTIAGYDIPNTRWGAAMAVACEDMKRLGYLTSSYELTDKGKRTVENIIESQFN